ncbi:MAG: carbonic anhydrase [Candidatus Kuenenia stuttgartiensis]|nr:carbonic anhydrase [Candidatus Kuenenia stuttgartiensis]MCZ2444211.1 carbonic anhydrase [Flavobacteriales bacterium]
MALSYQEILAYNEKWIADKTSSNPDFFHNLYVEQKPDYLFIGCSDSRVDPDIFTGLNLGDMFVHRNISNIVNPIDLNVASVIQYAIVNLKVKHIIVCGHYGCGGIKAAMEEKGIGQNSPWLQIIKDIYRIHKTELEKIKDETKRYDRLVELIVIEQTENVIEMDCIQSLKDTPDYPQIHGWVFDMRTGKIVVLDVHSKAENKTDAGSSSLLRKLKSLFVNKKKG